MTQPRIQIVSKRSERVFEVLDLVARLDYIMKQKLPLGEGENLRWSLTNDHPETMACPVGRGFYRCEVSIIHGTSDDVRITAETNLVVSQDGKPHLEIFSDSVGEDDNASPLNIAEHLVECLLTPAR